MIVHRQLADLACCVIGHSHTVVVELLCCEMHIANSILRSWGALRGVLSSDDTGKTAMH